MARRVLRHSRMAAPLVSKLPLHESFEAPYLEYWGILPLELGGDRVRVAVASEPAREVIEDLEASFGLPVELVPVSQEDLLDGIRRTFAASESVVELIKDLDAELGPAADAGVFG